MRGGRSCRSPSGVRDQLEIPLAAVEAAVRLARAAGARVVLDPAPAVPLREALLRELDVIRPNAAEAEVLTGAPAPPA